MLATKSIPTEHKDLIHDVSYDFHGTRMATCSSDQTVKVWDLKEDGEWTLTADWKTHSGSVWRVTWAHPEFGQVLATCSFDRTAAVWEEMIGEMRTEGRHRSWVKRASLVDSRTSVTDVKFAPKHQGLQLATCSVDGIVRIYEAPDVMNLSQWSLQHEISSKLKCSCLSWNPSRRYPPMLAVGSDDPNTSAGGKVQIYEYNDGIRKWNKVETIATVSDAVHDVSFAPNIGKSYHLLAIASKTLKIISIDPLRRDATLSGPTGLTKFELKQVADFNDHESQVWRVCWNVIGTVLVSSGDDNCVRLWKANYIDNWKCIAVKKGDGTQGEIEPRSQVNSASANRDLNKLQSNVRFGQVVNYEKRNLNNKGSIIMHHGDVLNPLLPEHCPYAFLQQPGRPRVSSTHDNRFHVRESLHNRLLTVPDLTASWNQAGVVASTSTVHRQLMDDEHREPPLISPQNFCPISPCPRRVLFGKCQSKISVPLGQHRLFLGNMPRQTNILKSPMKG